jgi:hypothetical protein
MHNWLIFQYHRVRAHSKMGVLRGWPSGRTDQPRMAESEGGTQEGR